MYLKIYIYLFIWKGTEGKTLKQTPCHAQSPMGGWRFNPTTQEIMTELKARVLTRVLSKRLNYLNHPGAPVLCIFKSHLKPLLGQGKI